MVAAQRRTARSGKPIWLAPRHRGWLLGLPDAALAADRVVKRNGHLSMYDSGPLTPPVRL